MSSSRQHPPALSRRERQIMDVVYRLGRAAAADIHRALPDRPTYTTVRGLLRILVEKGHLRQDQDRRRYVYTPSTPRTAAGAISLAHVFKTFFSDSPAEAMAAFLGSERQEISDREFLRLAAIVQDARRRRRGRR